MAVGGKIDNTLFTQNRYGIDMWCLQMLGELSCEESAISPDKPKWQHDYGANARTDGLADKYHSLIEHKCNKM